MCNRSCVQPRVRAGPAGRGCHRGAAGYPVRMRFGQVEVRPLGGGLGCLLMILISLGLSVVLTVCANLILR